MQKEAKDYLQRLLQWRKGSKAITEGALTQFIPEDGIYVYFRLHEEGDVMVVINNNNTEKQFASCDRFDECLGGSRSGTDVLTGKEIADLQLLRLQPKSVIIVELD